MPERKYVLRDRLGNDTGPMNPIFIWRSFSGAAARSFRCGISLAQVFRDSLGFVALAGCGKTNFRGEAALFVRIFGSEYLKP